MPASASRCCRRCRARWGQCVTRWLRFNRSRRSEIDGETVPDRNVEYLFYQTLVGAWPPGLDPGDADGVQGAGRADRAPTWSRRCARARKSRAGATRTRDYEAALAALCRRRRSTRRGPTRSSPISAAFIESIARLVGDLLAGAARAEADRAGGARHLPGLRVVGFQPGRPRQPPAAGLGLAPRPPERQSGRPVGELA